MSPQQTNPNSQNSQPMDYANIRQIVIDAVNPIKEQLDRIYDSLGKEFVRKDVLDPQLETIRDDVKELKQEVMGAFQKYLLYFCSIVGALLSLYTLLKNAHFLP